MPVGATSVWWWAAGLGPRITVCSGSAAVEAAAFRFLPMSGCWRPAYGKLGPSQDVKSDDNVRLLAMTSRWRLQRPENPAALRHAVATSAAQLLSTACSSLLGWVEEVPGGDGMACWYC
jgi:hypothetical protein